MHKRLGKSAPCKEKSANVEKGNARRKYLASSRSANVHGLEYSRELNSERQVAIVCVLLAFSFRNFAFDSPVDSIIEAVRKTFMSGHLKFSPGV